jgi:hypothetical protein
LTFWVNCGIYKDSTGVALTPIELVPRLRSGAGGEKGSEMGRLSNLVLDLLAGIVFFGTIFVVVGYAMDLAVGGPRNPLMDRGICAAAIMAVFMAGAYLLRNRGR